MKFKRYHLAIDGMRVLAILAVVCIHSTTRILEASNLNIQESTLAFFLNQVSRFAVPLFFMISGFVLEINYSFHQSYLTYLKKRFSRIFLPYLFWSAIYYFFIYKQHADSFLQAIFTGSASYQLYFIPTLLIFYILFPVVHKKYWLIENKLVLIALGVLQIILLIDDYYFHSISLFFPLAIASFNFFVFIFGMVAARHYKFLIRFFNKWKVVLILLQVVLALYIVFEGKTLYLKTYNYIYFYSQWRPSVLIYTLVVFVVSYALFSRLTKYETLIYRLSRLSFFVFFVHVIVLEFLWKINGPNWYGPLFFLSVAVISYAIAYFVEKIPYMRNISG